jgi:dienelactone hydrolase
VEHIEDSPGVVVIQEWWDDTGHMSLADRVAGANYRALVLDFRTTESPDIRSAVEYMKRTSTKAALVGFWNSVPSLEYLDQRQLDVPFQAHFATDHETFPRAEVEAFQAKIEQTGVRYELHWYKAGFDFADLGLQRMLDFLGKNLK